MKKKNTNVLSIIFTLLLSCLFITIPKTNVLALANSNARFDLSAIHDSDGADRTSWLSPCENNIVSNNPNCSINTYEYFSPKELYNNLTRSNYFTIQTHGCTVKGNSSYFALKCIDSNNKTSYLTRDYLKNAFKGHPGALSNLRVCFLGACNSGVSSHDMAHDIYTYGAKCSIGYTKSVLTQCNSYFLYAFNTNFADGNHSVSSALSLADSATYSKYGRSGETDKRVVYGDTSQKLY